MAFARDGAIGAARVVHGEAHSGIEALPEEGGAEAGDENADQRVAFAEKWIQLRGGQNVVLYIMWVYEQDID